MSPLLVLSTDDNGGGGTHNDVDFFFFLFMIRKNVFCFSLYPKHLFRFQETAEVFLVYTVRCRGAKNNNNEKKSCVFLFLFFLFHMAAVGAILLFSRLLIVDTLFSSSARATTDFRSRHDRLNPRPINSLLASGKTSECR